MKDFSVSRRSLLSVSALSLGVAASSFPTALFANTTPSASIKLNYMASPKKLVFINLSGAPDGLELVTPYADPSLENLRNSLYRGKPGKGGLSPLALDDSFAVSSKLPVLKNLYDKKQYIPIHAAGFEHENRSHFDAQNIMANGSLNPNNNKSGWLNRSIEIIVQKAKLSNESAPLLSFVPYSSAPLIVKGGANSLIVDPGNTPYLSDTYYRDLLTGLFGDKAPDLNNPLNKHTVLYRGLELRKLLNDFVMRVDSSGNLDKAVKTMSTEPLKAAVIGKLFSVPDGPRFATLSLGSWDSHATQRPDDVNGYGKLLQSFNDTIKALRDNMGAEWNNCVVIAGGEFGRTCRVNGTGGTDHGVGGAWHLLGGAVNGGRVMADWPGLTEANMVEGRYLKVTTNMVSIFKGILVDGFGLNAADLDTVFPGRSKIAAAKGLLRA